MDAAGSHAVGFAGSIELFLKYLADEDSEVRNNAAFSVGVLAANAATALEVWVCWDHNLSCRNLEEHISPFNCSEILDMYVCCSGYYKVTGVGCLRPDHVSFKLLDQST